MSKVTQILLDVLKPRSPSILELAKAIGDLGVDYQVCVDVKGVDAKTETVLIEICGQELNYSAISEIIAGMGGSVHSIDRVNVKGDAA